MSIKITYSESEIKLREIFSQSEVVDVFPMKANVVKDIVTACADNPNTKVRLLLGEDTVQDIKDNFILTANVVECINAKNIEVKKTEYNMTPVVAGEEKMSVILTNKIRSAVDINNTQHRTETKTMFQQQWENGETAAFRHPSNSTMIETLEDRLNTQLAERFIEYLPKFYPRAADERITQVDISLLFGAKHELLFYDLSHWGDYIGFGSRGTFSKKRQKLESEDIIKTEKHDSSVGRPKIKLTFQEQVNTIESTDEYLNERNTDANKKDENDNSNSKERNRTEKSNQFFSNSQKE